MKNEEYIVFYSWNVYRSCSRLCCCMSIFMDSKINQRKLEPEPCMHCGEKIIPLVRGLGNRAICSPCAIDRLGFLVFAIRAGCQAGERFLKDDPGK